MHNDTCAHETLDGDWSDQDALPAVIEARDVSSAWVPAETICARPTTMPFVLAGDPGRAAVIYALVDPLTPDVIMYVGRTLHPTTRYRQHCRGEGVVGAWIRALDEVGRAPLMVFLRSCDAETMEWHEGDWLAFAQVRGEAILNTYGGSLGHLASMERNAYLRMLPPARAERLIEEEGVFVLSARAWARSAAGRAVNARTLGEASADMEQS